MSYRQKRMTACLLAGLLLTTALPGNALAAEQKGEQAEKIQQELNGVDKELQDTLKNMQDLEAELSQGMKENEKMKREIAALEQRIEKHREKLKERVKVMYQKGDVSFWEVLFKATDFSDFLERLQLLSMIVEQDQDLIKQLRTDQAKLKTAKEQLDAQQKERRTRQETLRKAEQDLQAKAKNLKGDLAAALAAPAEDQHVVEQAYQSYTGPQFIPAAGGNGSYAWPVPSSFTISSGYGMRGSEFHKGIDITAPIGTPFVAVADGVVVQAGSASGYGHWIVIDHGNGVTSVYGHMYGNGILVSTGQTVRQGQVIGTTGNDGYSTGPHLHLSMQSGGAYVNPMAFLQ
ncbi:murein DD-endopeptidase MepM/ murein hydrolase activator NlpD [Tumebacillus sp. BK434]|uniref:murein hydrolase activator EnvC family protein n=1 Tax=Tumebacillus sp. BK434 TaxID=2512169 RepID=UPI001044266A|nr:peptidoglycan DD-metalloendopeptidase family protein [Tumebacillus sp. BK434]TCP52376.1 murein DD-endopeptidase MepM/ murein hydrolase activator NlpD [Tumebacillus sp. BK434]